MYLLTSTSTSTSDGGRCRVCTSSPERAVALFREMFDKELSPMITNVSGRTLSLLELQEATEGFDASLGLDEGRHVYRVTAEIDGAVRGEMLVAADTEREAESVGRWGLCVAMKLNFFDIYMVIRAKYENGESPMKNNDRFIYQYYQY